MTTEAAGGAGTTGARMSAGRRPRQGDAQANEPPEGSPQLNGGGERSGGRRGRRRVTSLRGEGKPRPARPAAQVGGGEGGGCTS